MLGSWAGLDLSRGPIWSLKVEVMCVQYIHNFQGKRLNENMLIYWLDLWDLSTRSRKH